MVGRGFLRRFAQALREERRDQPFALGTLLLNRLDVETQLRQRFREQLEVLVGHRLSRIRVGLDLLLAQAEQTFRVGETEDLERTANLLAVLRERRELRTLSCREERIQHLLHVTQVRRISRPTCASSRRSCARFDISSSSGAAALR